MAPTPITWSIALFALALRYPRGWLLYASGLAAGLGFYTFYSARTTMPILALFIVAQYGLRGCFTPRGFRDRMLELWPLLLGFVLAAAPIFAASGTAVITRMFNEVPGGYSSDITGPPGQKILMSRPSRLAASMRPLYTVVSTTSPATRNCGCCAPATAHTTGWASPRAGVWTSRTGSSTCGWCTADGGPRCGCSRRPSRDR